MFQALFRLFFTKFPGICPQYQNSFKKLQKIKKDLYKEPLSNFGEPKS